MFADAESYFSRLPGSFYGNCVHIDCATKAAAGGQNSDMPSLSAEDLIMAVHKASSRRIEVLSRTTGNVDQIVEGYKWQLKILTARSPAGLSVSTAVHAASVGEERFKKGDCRGASRVLRLALQAIGGEAGSGPAATASDPQAAHTAKLRRTILFSLAHCCSKSGDHNNAIKFIKHLEEGGGWCAKGGGANPPPKFLFAKCKVLTEAGDLTGAYTAAEALVAVTPAPSGRLTAGVGDGEPGDGLDLAAARLISSREDCSDQSLDLFAAIASRFAGTPKAVDARVALLSGLAMAARLRAEGCGAGWWSPDGQHEKGSAAAATADKDAVERADKTADDMIAEISGCNSVATSQASFGDGAVNAALEVLVTFTEFFQGREQWETCARWCGRAINLANRDSKGSTPKGVPDANKAALLLASLLTLRGEMECRTGDFTSSSQTLDQALALCPTYGRAREVAFWSAACDPNRDESSLSARLSALSGPRARLTPGARREYLATCVGLVAGVRKATRDPQQPGERDAGEATYDTRVTMVQERLLEALLLEAPATTNMRKEAEPTQAQPSTSSTPHEVGPDKVGPAGSLTVRAEEDDCRGLAPTPMAIEGEGDGDEGDVPVAGTGGATPSGNCLAGSNGNGTGAVPTAVQVVASMVDSALQWISKHELQVQRGSVEDAASVLSRVLLSVDKTLRCAGSLGIGPLDDPDIQYLSHGCWNLAVRCCGPNCDLPWADRVGTSATKGQTGTMSVDGATHAESKRNGLLVLAPAFFKASRNWTEIGSDANMEDALLRRQNCMVLSIAATLELYDSKPADGASLANVTTGSSERRDMLERSRKEVEVATGLNRLLGDVKPEKATEMRSILLVAEISVLGRLRDSVAVRSLVASRKPDFLRCSTNLLQYCLQLAEDMLDDAKSTAGLCRLCIRRCVEEDPVDTCALGGFYRRLLVSASSREEALLVVDEFTAKSRDLQEGPGMPSDVVDYVSAKCYNLGLQLLEMSRPGEAERFVGKALGLLKLGSSPAFVRRWEEAIHKVYRTTLQAKGDAETSNNPIMPGGSGSQVSTGTGGRAFLSTGLFPMP
ncbi:unnamed protein product [Ectocarpus fasciculatus]